MKQYIPIVTVVVALLLLKDTIPKFVTYFLILILILLVINRWGVLKQLFE